MSNTPGQAWNEVDRKDTSNVPSLDVMDDSELRTFAVQHSGGKCHRLLFPAGGRGTVKATRLLALYAENKSAAIRHRLTGNINEALRSEWYYEANYENLPMWARW